MEAKLIKIGNSFGVRIPKSLIQEHNLSGDIEIRSTEAGVLINARNCTRADWEEKLAAAINAGHKPDDELLEGFNDEQTDSEWHW